MPADRTEFSDLGDTPEEQFVAMKVLAGVLFLAIGSAGVLWLAGVRWLIEHNVLVGATASPALALPHSGGAGLDAARLFVLACAITAGAAILISSALHRLRHRRSYL